MAAHSYWRLLITQSVNPFCQIAEWAFFDGVGSAISTAGGSASSNSVYGTGYEASKAFDGNTSTVWSAAATPTVASPIWLQHQFASAVDVASISITAGDAGKVPQDFQLQFSDDGSTWTDLHSYKGVGWTGSGVATRTFTAANANPVVLGIAWRVLVNSVYGPGVPVQIYEIILRDGSGTPINTSSYAGISSSTFSGDSSASFAFDGDHGTWWNSSIASNVGQWVGHRFGSVVQVGSFCLFIGTGSGGVDPQSVSLQYSYDEAIWTTVATETIVHTPGLQQCFTVGSLQPPTTISGGTGVRGNIDWDQVGKDARHGPTYGILVQYSDGTHTAGNSPVWLPDGTLTDGGGTGGPIGVNGNPTLQINGTAASFDNSVLVNGA